MSEKPAENWLPNRPRNRVLSHLPLDIWLRVAPQMGHCLLIQGRPLIEAGQAVERVYFLNGGLVSQVAHAPDGANGSCVEIGLTGRDGLLGLSEALNGTPSLTRGVVQIAGTACWLPADILRAEFRRGGAFQNWLLRYLQWQTTQAAQSALCNCLHSVETRLARWLLTAHDRVGDDEIAVTHETIASLLGARRSSVTVNLGHLEQDGLLHCARGRILLLDAEALARRTCSCHAALREQAELLRLNDFKF